MSEEHNDGPAAGSGPDADAEGQSKSRRGRMGDGIRQGIGVLSAFKDALEETIQEARDRGDLSTDRAKEVMKGALDRAQSAAEDAKEKLDFARQAELDGLNETVVTLKASLDALRQRVRTLEETVYGPGHDQEAEQGDA